jgi:hypothetical protein
MCCLYLTSCTVNSSLPNYGIKFEDIKGVLRSLNSEDKWENVQNKKGKSKYNGMRNIMKKTKAWKQVPTSGTSLVTVKDKNMMWYGNLTFIT